MTADAPPPHEPAAEDDTGEPIEILRALEHDTSDTFIHGVRRRMERRLLAGDMIQMFWTNIGGLVMEIVGGVLGAFGRGRGAAPRKES
jgi:hypothetical protein